MEHVFSCVKIRKSVSTVSTRIWCLSRDNKNWLAAWHISSRPESTISVEPIMIQMIIKVRTYYKRKILIESLQNIKFLLRKMKCFWGSPNVFEERRTFGSPLLPGNVNGISWTRPIPLWISCLSWPLLVKFVSKRSVEVRNHRYFFWNWRQCNCNWGYRCVGDRINKDELLGH